MADIAVACIPDAGCHAAIAAIGYIFVRFVRIEVSLPLAFNSLVKATAHV
jgi:hypothetical protein